MVAAAQLLRNHLPVERKGLLRGRRDFAGEQHVLERQYGRNVQPVRARHAVVAAVAGDCVQLQERLRRVLKHVELLGGAFLEGREGRQVLLDVRCARHAGEDGEHVGERPAESEGPSGERGLGVAGRQFVRQRPVVSCEASAEKRLHHDDGDLAVRQRLVQILCVEVAVVDLLGVAPIDVVHLDLAEVPFVLRVVLDAPLERLRVSVERKSKVANLALFAQLKAPVRRTVRDVALRERVEAAVAYRVQEVEVDVVSPQELQRVREHLLGLFKRILPGREVGELRRDEEIIPVVSALRQGLAKPPFGLSAAVGRRRVEVVDAAVKQHLHLPVH